MSVRAKFYCTSTKKTKNWRGGGFLYDYEFLPVADDGTEENKAFWEATPSGKLNLHSVQVDLFEVGKGYYLDFTEAVEEAAAD